jgi:hypothetical protein
MKDIEQAAKDAGVHDSQIPDDFISRVAPMPRRTRKRNTLEDLDYIGAEVELLTQRVQELEKALRAVLDDDGLADVIAAVGEGEPPFMQQVRAALAGAKESDE